MNNPAKIEEILAATPVCLPEWPILTLEEIADGLTKAENVLILTHVNPDGDCIGSAFALKEILFAMGKNAAVLSPSELPKRLRFLCGDQQSLALDSVDVDTFDLILSLDVASPMQLGELAVLIPRIDWMIDHHGMGETYARNYIDPNASAAGEIVYAIYQKLKERGAVGKCPEAARRMYAAIVSDTGSFKFSNTTPDTHITASVLLDEINTADDGGMDASDVCRSLFGQRTLKELTAQMLAIQNLRFYEDGALGAVIFTQQMLADAGLTEEEIGNVVDTPRGVEGVLVGISLRQLAADPTQYKVSSRANAEIDCAAVCAAFGGGGHIRAAGCTVTADTPEEALDMMAQAFGEAVRAYVQAKKG
ncbi:MAG: bifunctional oligoribonuclease/PAP phosphatase NrnA [Clostridia bacterium]|nr:bifunctional oligoribonuclease/PAP phosphatase NrnA [Clostridia bacterium]